MKSRSQGRDYRNLDLGLVESILSLLLIILFNIVWPFKLDLNKICDDLEVLLLYISTRSRSHPYRVDHARLDFDRTNSTYNGHNASFTPNNFKINLLPTVPSDWLQTVGSNGCRTQFFADRSDLMANSLA